MFVTDLPPKKDPELRARRSRPQQTMAMVVDLGIELINAEGRYVAAKFMEDAGVPLRVIARVIAEPELRRGAGSPWKKTLDTTRR
ncbi:hypothetical protein [Duganella callida]|uniref:Uncharacterized protein n=1 Tax=Duganella callida TaxID=2561932 RepID=A0A4Y9S7L9_9BURK|nr:hypothetical protein [Duganella callida]TFW17273.1 hypothetical protein E4L98_21120 [Duganella callida]